VTKSQQNQPGFGQKNTTAIRRGDQNMVFLWRPAHCHKHKWGSSPYHLAV